MDVFNPAYPEIHNGSCDDVEIDDDETAEEWIYVNTGQHRGICP